MRSFVSAALAGLIGIGALSATVSTASADPWDYHHHHHYYGHGDRGWGGVGAGLAAGTVLGLGIGALAAQPRYDEEVPPPRSISWRNHVDYCMDRYRTYDPDTDTYIGQNGAEYRCRGSY